MPALQQAKRVGKAVLCTSNLKQFGIAFHGYANDYKEWLPPLSDKDGVVITTDFNTWWSRKLSDGGYLPVKNGDWAGEDQGTDAGKKRGSCYKGVWRCPEMSDEHLPGAATYGGGGGYGVLQNSAIAGHGMADEPPRSWNLVRCPHVANRYLLGDVWDRAYSPPTTKLALWCPICIPWTMTGRPQSAPVHLGNTSNILHGDGHVVPYKYSNLLLNANDIFHHTASQNGCN